MHCLTQGVLSLQCASRNSLYVWCDHRWQCGLRSPISCRGTASSSPSPPQTTSVTRTPLVSRIGLLLLKCWSASDAGIPAAPAAAAACNKVLYVLIPELALLRSYLSLVLPVMQTELVVCCCQIRQLRLRVQAVQDFHNDCR